MQSMQKETDENDRKLLLRALDIAIEGIPEGGGPFGAVIAKDGKILSEAYNEVVNSNDPTSHAEILAIRRACKSIGSYTLDGCTLYTSCEPCPMCLGALYWAGISRVIYASDRKDAADAGFSDDLFYVELQKDPDLRKVMFNKIEDVDGQSVFRVWDNFEDKIIY
jgi:guanine deaminase